MAEEEKQEKKEPVTPQVLQDLENEIDVGFIEATYTYRKRTWKMRTLCDHEKNWMLNYLHHGSFAAAGRSRKAPTLAIGIREINGQSIQVMFQEQWDSQDSAMNAALSTNIFARQYWCADQLYTWLASRTDDFIDELFAFWSKLEKRREEAQKELGESSAGTSTDSKDTKEGSPSKEDSSPSSSQESLVSSLPPHVSEG